MNSRISLACASLLAALPVAAAGAAQAPVQLMPGVTPRVWP